MKKKVIVTAFAAVCLVAAGVSGLNVYTVTNQSEVDILLTENVEALSQEEVSNHTECDAPADPQACWANNNPWDFRGMSWTHTKKVSSYGNCLCMGSSRSCPDGSSTR